MNQQSNQRKARKRYSKEFKDEAVKLVLEQGMSKAQVTRDLGISHGIIARWIKESQSQGEKAFPGNGTPSEQNKRIIELEKENKRLRMERDILKKATAFFASHGK